jgi:hypothetical protein
MIEVTQEQLAAFILTDEIVLDLAQEGPYIGEDGYCVFCSKLHDTPHDEDCVYRRALAYKESVRTD